MFFHKLFIHNFFLFQFRLFFCFLIHGFCLFKKCVFYFLNVNLKKYLFNLLWHFMVGYRDNWSDPDLTKKIRIWPKRFGSNRIRNTGGEVGKKWYIIRNHFPYAGRRTVHQRFALFSSLFASFPLGGPEMRSGSAKPKM